jgi:hypothetical protein
MNRLTQSPPEPQTAPQDQPLPQQNIDLQAIVEHLGRVFRITPIGSRRFRCNKYARSSELFPTGRLAETFVLQVSDTGIKKLSDHQPKSNWHW